MNKFKWHIVLITNQIHINMKKLYFTLSLALFSLFSFSQGVDYLDVEPIFQSNCAGCHGSSGGFTIGFDQMVEVPSNQLSSMNRIEPNDPANSYVYLKMTGDHISAGGSGGSMPPSGSVSPADLELIEQWINDGALYEIVGIEEEISASFAQFSNSPNPVSIYTNFTFSLSEPQRINITIYDISGKQMEIVSSENFSAGKHSVQWFTNGQYEEGLYLVQFDNGIESHVDKILIVD